MASVVKGDDEKTLSCETPSGAESSHVNSNNPDEIIGIPVSASHSNSIINDSASCSKESITSNKCDSKLLAEISDSSVHLSSTQNNQPVLKPSEQESEVGKTGLGVAQVNSDDEYQSADDGEENYGSDAESDDFIPTTDILPPGEKENEETNSTDTTATRNITADDSGDADGSETEEESPLISAEDLLEERRKLEDALTEEEKQERKTKSQQMKDEGNAKFRSGEYDDAIFSYTEALDLCPLDCHKERSIMFANRAACKMKQECFEDAIADSSSALELHPHYLKAILRRAELYEKTEKLDEAVKDYQKVVELDPSQHAARASVFRLNEQIKERNEKMKEEMMGKLKDLGNMVLRPFGLSVNNFNLQQDPNTGSYSVQFNQNAPGNGT